MLEREAESTPGATTVILRRFPDRCPPPGWPSLILHAASRDIEYSEHAAPLSVKCVLRGEEMHEVCGGARYRVRSDRYLLLNHGQLYASWIHSAEDVEILSIFFREALVGEVAGALTRKTEELLDEPQGPWGPVHFFEGLYAHDDLVTPGLTGLVAALGGTTTADERWIDEQLRFLVERLVGRHLRLARRIDELPPARASTRRELYRRLMRARDYLDSSLGEAVDLASAARVACLSPFHFLRSFKAAFGLTPHRYLTRARIERACELLLSTDRPVTEICFAVGFESLGSFSSLFRRWAGISPSRYRSRGGGAGAGRTVP